MDILFFAFTKTVKVFSLEPTTLLTEIASVSPLFTYLSVLYAEMTLAEGRVKSMKMDVSHKSLAAINVPFKVNTFLYPGYSAAGMLAWHKYANGVFSSVVLKLKIYAAALFPVAIKLLFLS